MLEVKKKPERPRIRIKSKSPKEKKRITSLTGSMPNTTKATNKYKPTLKINQNTYFRPVFLTLQKKGDKEYSEEKPSKPKKMDKRSSIFRGLGNFDPKNSFIERVSKVANEKNK